MTSYSDDKFIYIVGPIHLNSEDSIPEDKKTWRSLGLGLVKLTKDGNFVYFNKTKEISFLAVPGGSKVHNLFKKDNGILTGTYHLKGWDGSSYDGVFTYKE